MDQKVAHAAAATQPAVSIYIPTHNRPELLERAIDSCLAQSHVDFEVLVSDDGSGPETEKLVRAKMERDSRIRFFRSPKPRGACHARNVAINSARGEFITGLDDDDEFPPERISTLLAHWREGYSFVCANMSVRNSGEEGPGKPFYATRRNLEFDYSDLLFKNCASNQVFTKTTYLQGIGGFNEELKKFQDWDTWLRLAHRYGPFLRLSDPLYILYNYPTLTRVSKAITHKQALAAFFAQNSSLYSGPQKEIMQFLIANRSASQKLLSITASSLALKSSNLLRHYGRVAYRNYLRNYV